METEIAILRKCRCCRDWLPIERFSPLGILCRVCVDGKTASNHIARSRAIVLTDKGRAALEELAAA